MPLLVGRAEKENNAVLELVTVSAVMLGTRIVLRTLGMFFLCHGGEGPKCSRNHQDDDGAKMSDVLQFLSTLIKSLLHYGSATEKNEQYG